MRVIAVTGKGGTGKTAVSALLIRHFSKDKKSILAIDADPDSNLPDALGERVEKTIGDMREYMFAGKENMPQDISKERILESKLYEVLVETPRYDLLVMGRPEGPGCYCYTNNLLRGIMDRIIKNYDLTIIDTPAGLEHLSRGLIRDVDELIVVTDGSRRGIQTAERIRDLAGKLSLKIKKIYVLANKVTPDSLERIRRYASELGLEMIGAVSFDENLARYDLEGEPLAKLPEESVSVREIGRIAERIRG